MTSIAATAEAQRLEEDRTRQRHWKRWGPYVSARQWGTVREDYSAQGHAWTSFGHDQARSRAYRWGEDGIAGVCDNHQRLCFALTLWNGEDAILKERLFGLTNDEGNHGEDVKEYYFFLDNTPTHSYMKLLYKYPQTAFPYRELVEESARRHADPGSSEFELLDTGAFADDRYFDVLVEYAKATPEDLLVRVTAVNRGPETRVLHLLPTLWFRNTWSWRAGGERPQLGALSLPTGGHAVVRARPAAGLQERWLHCEGAPQLLFTENETNFERLRWGTNASPYVKDAFEAYVLRGERRAVNPAQVGTKAAAYYRQQVPAGGEVTLRLRLSDQLDLQDPFGPAFDDVFAARQREADEFYLAVTPFDLPEDLRRVQRQAFAGLLWSKQFYHYVVRDWLEGDETRPAPPERRRGRNHEWAHLYNEDVLSMPDTWEYPWFAAWDLAFHAIALVLVDPELAKKQLALLTREWYLHPNGQMPAYEWAFGDVNPPVHAWAAWRVYKIEQKMYGRADRDFLERVFHKLALNFTWWVNRKDRGDNNLFEGGFLGLDNVGPFDRSTLPAEVAGFVEQADGTGWVAMYCLSMLRIALELSTEDPTYVEMATKFFQHFLYIAEAVNRVGGEEASLWDDQDGFYYDILHVTDPDRRIDGREHLSLKIRSMVGVVPLFAVEAIDAAFLETRGGGELEEFAKRLRWLLDHRPELARHENVSILDDPTPPARGLLLSLVNRDKLERILARVLDRGEFLSPHGVRSVSKFHERSPFVLRTDRGREFRVEYAPAESRTRDFGGNSNWRGPIWFPVNFLLIESLQKWDRFLGEELTVEYPTGSGQKHTLWDVAMDLSQRLIAIFQPDADGHRPLYGSTRVFQEDPHWRDLVLFFEYFHGDNGAGLGASHQTGWTALVAKLIQQWGEYGGGARPPRR